MPALMLLYMLLDLPLENRIALFDRSRSFDDEGFGHLALAVGGNSDDDAVVHRRVREEVGFQFCWGDLEAFDFDEPGGRVSVWSCCGEG